MESDKASECYQRLAEAAPDMITRLFLDARANEVRKQEKPPFAHPIDWAAFQVIGRTKLRLPTISHN